MPAETNQAIGINWIQLEMASASRSLLLLLLFVSFGGLLSSSSTDGEKRLHIVYMGEKHHNDPEVVTALHHDTIASVLGGKEQALESIVYSYRHGFSGFAAMLTDHQAELLAEMAGVISVELSGTLRLHTTRSWDFLRLSSSNPSGLLRRANAGDGAIIGVIDSGIWPESKSFDDSGYGPIPQRWKGKCQSGVSFNASNCNRKIIGARFYSGGIDKSMLDRDYLSPRDNFGHGTHCASIAAGSHVKNVSFHGLGTGTARGGAPMARLAIYKIFWGDETTHTGNEASIIKAIDDAIHDGVDVLSLSLSSNTGSWASLQAVMKGITVVYSAGNNGPTPKSVWNLAPWAITVAATTIDRSFPTALTLGNNHTVIGQGYAYKSSNIFDQFVGITYGATCEASILKTMNQSNIEGKLVLCTMGTNPLRTQFQTALNAVFHAKGAAMIFAKYPSHLLSDYPLPVVEVDFEVHQQILNYIESARSPVAKLKPTWTAEGREVLAPIVASFSSRGPSKIFPGVLKPDIAAPGVNILAAVKDSYEFMSGTSMAAPAIAGIVALIKAVHPNWSPAAIKSALITTASTKDEFGLPILAEGVPRKIADPFDFGGGNVNPIRAAEPGLVYDIDPNDYKEFHCSWARVLVCETWGRPVYHLNLPSISIPDLKTEVTISRTVTNVGPTDSVYQVLVEAPPGVEMVVEPARLVFDAQTTWNRFRVTFRALRRVQGVYSFGSLTWFDGRHQVRIPVAVRTVILDSFSDSG